MVHQAPQQRPVSGKSKRTERSRRSKNHDRTWQSSGRLPAPCPCRTTRTSPLTVTSLSLIPDGTIKSAQFVKTPSYVQVSGWWDGTKLNIKSGDQGGELDPHGATGEGNPVGGNVTTSVATGKDVFYEEWMAFVSYGKRQNCRPPQPTISSPFRPPDQFCVRICTANVNGVSVAKQCDHIYDLMGCEVRN